MSAGRGSGDAAPGHALRCRVLPADLLTPVGAYLRLGGAPNSFLLESVEGGAARGRYSVIGTSPDLLWRCRDGQAAIGRPDGSGWRWTADEQSPLDSLRALLARHRIAPAAGAAPDAVPPVAGALVGYLGYDLVRSMERLPPHERDTLGLPDALLLRPTLFAIFDHVRDELVLATPVWSDGDGSGDDAEVRLDRAVRALAQPLPTGAVAGRAEGTAPGGEAAAATVEPVANVSRDEFLATVRRCQEWIAAGDVFQVVPSQRFSMPFALSPLAFYRALRRINPAPFLFLLELDAGDRPFALAGSSPEVLVRLRDNTVTVRPLAGTRPRGRDRADDLRLERELLADPKERAEHLMLLDLGRNDVGRVAEPASVRVTESFTVERYSHVMHISSNVEGTLRADCDAVSALQAGFPAGTLSGAPKIRAMEIIAAVEPLKRGVYGGCIGYFAPDGSMDTCIGLRTAVLQDGVMHVQAGCGVVADSVPEAEWEETRIKARALFRAADAARAFAPAGERRDG